MGQGVSGSCNVDAAVQKLQGTEDSPPERPSEACCARGSQLICEGWSSTLGVVACSAVGRDVFLYTRVPGARANKLSKPKGVVTCLLSRGNALFTGSVDRSVRRYDLETQDEVLELSGHDGCVWCLAMAGGVLFSASEDATIIGWNPSSGERLTRLVQHTLPVRCLLEVGDCLISGADDGSLISWDLRNFQQVACTQAHNSAITCMLRLDDGTVFTGCADGGISRWMQQCRAAMGRLEGHNEWVTCLVAFEDWLFSSSRSPVILRWDIETGQLSLRLDTGTSAFTFVKWSMDIRMLDNCSFVVGLPSDGENRFIKMYNDDGTVSFLGIDGCPMGAYPKHVVRTVGDVHGDYERFNVIKKDDGLVALQNKAGGFLTVLPDNRLGAVWLEPGKETEDTEHFKDLTLEGHFGGVNTLQIVNGVLMSGGVDRSVKVWHPGCGVQYGSVEGRSGITCIKEAAGCVFAALARGHVMKVPKPAKQPPLKHRRHLNIPPQLPSKSVVSAWERRPEGSPGSPQAFAGRAGVNSSEASVDLGKSQELRLDDADEAATPAKASRSHPSPQQLPTVAPPMDQTPPGASSDGMLPSPVRAGLRPPPASGGTKVIIASSYQANSPAL